MLSDLILLIVLLLLSGFYSSTELAFVVSNKVKIEIRARKQKLTARNAQYFVENQNVFFSTILIANNIINISFASIVTIFMHDNFALSEPLILLISTTLLLLLGELIPKYIAHETADSFVTFSAIPLRLSSIILFPFVKIAASVSSLIIDPENKNEANVVKLFDRDDIETLLNESTDAGSVDLTESDIIKKIIDLGEQKIYEAMTPRTDIVGVEIQASMIDTIKIFSESGYSKLPVFEENHDNIKGIIYAYDLFRQPKELKEIIHDVIFVPETKKSLEMLNEFSLRGVSIAVVVDEFGGTAGIITVEDIVEELLGEIQDEYDVDEFICKQIDDSTYVISAKVEIDHINEKYDLNIPEGDYETIGGYITSELGKIPERGEIVGLEHLSFSILRSDKTKIDLVKLTVDREFFE